MKNLNKGKLGIILLAVIAVVAYFLPYATVDIYLTKMSFSAFDITFGVSIEAFGTSMEIIEGNLEYLMFLLFPILIMILIVKDLRFSNIIIPVLTIVAGLELLFYGVSVFRSDEENLSLGIGFWLLVISWSGINLLSDRLQMGIVPLVTRLVKGEFRSYLNNVEKRHPASNAQFCPECGMNVKEGESFCANCGSEIQGIVNKTEKEEGRERIEQGKKKRGNKNFFIFGGIGAALILFGGVIWSGAAKTTGRETDENFPSISNESVSSKTFDFRVDRAWATDTIKCPEEEQDRFDGEYLSPIDENAIFYIVEFTFTNTSDQTIDERPVIRLIDSSGVVYERDEEVTTYTKQGGTSPDYSVYDQGIQSEPMAPGLSLKGQCTFVIAKDRLDHNGSVTCSRSLLAANSTVEWLTGFNFGAEESVSVSLGGAQENNTQESYGDVSKETEVTEFSANPSEEEITELASSQDNGQLKTEDSTYSNEDTGNESANNQPQEKSITGVYALELGNEGGAELEITYSSGDDSFLVYFSGNYEDQAGETKGYLVAHTDGTDGIWEYYEYSAYEAGNYVPSMQLEYDAADTITVTSLDGQSFGGMDFPGFDGTYLRTAEYSMP
ncbi:zinc-ribbon domain-containing protein [Lacrimispora sp.]|uniref:zinc-ribbon domain-containing protein n=1 Tax=Lacrimispora sp. TaxID=2719234 RepID=UPI00399210A1